jgi:hypothetical protein
VSQLDGERDAEIIKIAQSITELSVLFRELSVLVIEQGTVLDRIDYNVEHTLLKVLPTPAVCGERKRGQIERGGGGDKRDRGRREKDRRRGEGGKGERERRRRQREDCSTILLFFLRSRRARRSWSRPTSTRERDAASNA